MKWSLWCLPFFLFAVTIGTDAFSGPNEAVLAGSGTDVGVGLESPIVLAGANGHDSVGALIPLPLWPPAIGAHGAPAKSWKRRSRFCCVTMRQPSKARQ
jgi:hypothetical protein